MMKIYTDRAMRYKGTYNRILDSLSGHGPFVVHVYGESREFATAQQAAAVAAKAEDYAEGFVQITVDGDLRYGGKR